MENKFSKYCVKCGEDRDIDQFQVHPKAKCGYFSNCNGCRDVKRGKGPSLYERIRAGHPEQEERPGSRIQPIVKTKKMSYKEHMRRRYEYEQETGINIDAEKKNESIKRDLIFDISYGTVAWLNQRRNGRLKKDR